MLGNTVRIKVPCLPSTRFTHSPLENKIQYGGIWGKTYLFQFPDPLSYVPVNLTYPRTPLSLFFFEIIDFSIGNLGVFGGSSGAT